MSEKCLLCFASAADATLAAALWSAWDPGDARAAANGKSKHGQWILKVNELLVARGIEPVSQEEIGQHFSDHFPVQPKPLDPVKRDSISYGLEAVGPGFEQIIEGVFRQQMMTTAQIRDMYFPGEQLGKVCTQLNYAAQAHYLYRYHPDQQDIERRGVAEVLDGKPGIGSFIWYLGRSGAVWIEEELGIKYKPPHVDQADKIGKLTLGHDLRLTQCAVDLKKALDQQQVLQYEEEDLIASLEFSNWYGPSMAGLSFGYWHPWKQHQQNLLPDALIGLSIHSSVHGPGAVAFFLEFDHGSKESGDVVDQLWSYNALAASGASGKRFPQFAGWKMPVLMIFSSAAQMESVVEKFQEKYGSEKQGSPIFYALSEEWQADPLGKIIGSVWHGTARRSIIDAAMDASRPVFGRVPPGQPFDIELKAARPKYNMTRDESKKKPAKKVKVSSDKQIETKVNPNAGGQDKNKMDDFSDEVFTDDDAPQLDQAEMIRDLSIRRIAAMQYVATLDEQLAAMTSGIDEPQVIPPPAEPSKPTNQLPQPAAKNEEAPNVAIPMPGEVPDVPGGEHLVSDQPAPPSAPIAPTVPEAPVTPAPPVPDEPAPVTPTPPIPVPEEPAPVAPIPPPPPTEVPVPFVPDVAPETPELPAVVEEPGPVPFDPGVAPVAVPVAPAVPGTSFPSLDDPVAPPPVVPPAIPEPPVQIVQPAPPAVAVPQSAAETPAPGSGLPAPGGNFPDLEDDPAAGIVDDYPVIKDTASPADEPEVLDTDQPVTEPELAVAPPAAPVTPPPMPEPVVPVVPVAPVPPPAPVVQEPVPIAPSVTEPVPFAPAPVTPAPVAPPVKPPAVPNPIADEDAGLTVEERLSREAERRRGLRNG